jgi:hypothetical protein
MHRDYLFDYKELRWIYKWNSSCRKAKLSKNFTSVEASFPPEEKENSKEMERY